jgi:hypothetical protein
LGKAYPVKHISNHYPYYGIMADNLENYPKGGSRAKAIFNPRGKVFLS